MEMNELIDRIERSGSRNAAISIGMASYITTYFSVSVSNPHLDGWVIAVYSLIGGGILGVISWLIMREFDDRSHRKKAIKQG